MVPADFGKFDYLGLFFKVNFMENLKTTREAMEHVPDFQSHLNQPLNPEEKKQLQNLILELKTKYQEFMDSQDDPKNRQGINYEVEKTGGAEILEVDVNDLCEKDLCAFKLYKAMRDSNTASIDDWKKFMIGLDFYRRETRGKKINPSSIKESQNEFLAWLCNLALVEYSKSKQKKSYQ